MLLGPSGQACHHRNEFGGLDRFGDVHLKTGEERTSAIFGSRKSGQCDRGHLTAFLDWQLPDAPYHAVAVFAGHADVHNCDVWF